jgi:PhnB protein
MAKLNPYLHFKDNTREAMDFYKSIFGGELTMSTFREGMNMQGPGSENIMHAQLTIGPEMTIMASDAPEGMPLNPGASVGMSLSGEASDEEKLKGYWEGLSNGANITVPLASSPWGDTFGMLTDKFGMEWMVNIAGKKE